jgi:hypothetical protein
VNRSVLGREGLRKVNSLGLPVQAVPENLLVTTASDSRHLITGLIHLPISVKGRSETLPVLVMPSLNHTLILGVDFFKSFQVSLTIKNDTWLVDVSPPRTPDATTGLYPRSRPQHSDCRRHWPRRNRIHFSRFCLFPVGSVSCKNISKISNNCRSTIRFWVQFSTHEFGGSNFPQMRGSPNTFDYIRKSSYFFTPLMVLQKQLFRNPWPKTSSVVFTSNMSIYVSPRFTP